MKKTILITGSTDGIGKLTAKTLAKEGHIVYVHARNQEKLDKTISEIIKETGNNNIKGFASDFSDLSEVKRMADEIKNEISTIDVLINNAGVFKTQKQTNTDGIDLRMVVNYLAPYLLTKKISDLFNQSSRIINLSSAAQSTVSMEVLSENMQTDISTSYAQSKLALTMWSFYLSSKIDAKIIAVNPGSLLNTKMAREAYGRSWSSAEKGSTLLHDLAVSEKFESITGKYFDNDQGRFADVHPDAYNESKINELIKKTDKILEELK